MKEQDLIDNGFILLREIRTKYFPVYKHQSAFSTFIKEYRYEEDMLPEAEHFIIEVVYSEDEKTLNRIGIKKARSARELYLESIEQLKEIMNISFDL